MTAVVEDRAHQAAMRGLEIQHSMGGFGDTIIHAIQRYAPRIAFIDGPRSITYEQLGRDIAHTIAVLNENGARPGDRIMQISVNRYEMFVIMAASYIGGFISVPLQYNGDDSDHCFSIESCRPTLLFADEERKARVVGLVAQCKHQPKLLVHEQLNSYRPREAPEPLTAWLGRFPAEAGVRMIYSGGTTGRSKAALSSSAGLMYSSLLLSAAHEFTADTCFILAAPISHGIGSFIVPVLVKGGRLLVHQGFNAAAVIEAVTKQGANAMLLVPSMLYKLLDAPGVRDIPKGAIKRIIYGAAPIQSNRLEQALSVFGPVMAQSYGQSEAPTALLYLSPEDHLGHPDRLSSAGRPYPGVQVRLVNDGEVVPRRSRQVGEICVRTPHVMLGYWEEPELTAQAIRDGWLHTGDLAYEDEEGLYYIVGRAKDMVISGGFNIYPAEIEDAINEHPAVKASAVIGVPDPKWGEALMAFVVFKEGATVSADELQSFVRDKKGSVKTPKTFEFVEQLPLTNVGKIDKKTLRSPFWKDAVRSVN